MKYQCTEENFLKDVVDHKMFVLRDDGIYRHVAFKKPGTSDMRFDLITWPGCLCYTGDMGTYVFQRTTDMFTFFRSEPGEKARIPINPDYWSQKLDAVDRSDGVKKFSIERFREAVREHLNNKNAREIEEELLTEDYGNEYEAQKAVQDLEGYEDVFADFYEIDVTEYVHRFLWCCHALVWAIQQYDKAKEATAAVGAQA